MESHWVSNSIAPLILNTFNCFINRSWWNIQSKAPVIQSTYYKLILRKLLRIKSNSIVLHSGVIKPCQIRRIHLILIVLSSVRSYPHLLAHNMYYYITRWQYWNIMNRVAVTKCAYKIITLPILTHENILYTYMTSCRF